MSGKEIPYTVLSNQPVKLQVEGSDGVQYILELAAMVRSVTDTGTDVGDPPLRRFELKFQFVLDQRRADDTAG